MCVSLRIARKLVSPPAASSWLSLIYRIAPFAGSRDQRQKRMAAQIERFVVDVSRARIAKLDLNPIFLCVLQPERGFVAAAGGKALIIKETQVKVKCRSSSFACCCSSDIVAGRSTAGSRTPVRRYISGFSRKCESLTWPTKWVGLACECLSISISLSVN